MNCLKCVGVLTVSERNCIHSNRSLIGLYIQPNGWLRFTAYFPENHLPCMHTAPALPTVVQGKNLRETTCKNLTVLTKRTLLNHIGRHRCEISWEIIQFSSARQYISAKKKRYIRQKHKPGRINDIRHIFV